MDVKERRAEKGEVHKDKNSLNVHMKESTPLKRPHILHECTQKEKETDTYSHTQQQTIHRHIGTNRV